MGIHTHTHLYIYTNTYWNWNYNPPTPAGTRGSAWVINPTVCICNIPRDIVTSSCHLQKTDIDGSCFTPKWSSQPSLGTMLLRTCRPIWTTYLLGKNYIGTKNRWPRLEQGGAREWSMETVCSCNRNSAWPEHGISFHPWSPSSAMARSDPYQAE